MTPESLARAKSQTKKVENLLKKSKSDSMISLRNSIDPFENILIEELGTAMLLRDYDDSADVSSHPSYNIMKFR